MIHIGTDILEVSRIKKNIESKKDRFLNRIFTEKEIEYCRSKSNPAIHYMGRFAAKEAIKKAVLSSRLISRISMKEIEIVSEEGIPRVNITSLSNLIRLSISHTDNFATATAIIIE